MLIVTACLVVVLLLRRSSNVLYERREKRMDAHMKDTFGKAAEIRRKNSIHDAIGQESMRIARETDENPMPKIPDTCPVCGSGWYSPDLNNQITHCKECGVLLK